MSINRGWKQFERRIGRLLGGESSWKDDQDFSTPLFSGECKLLRDVPKFVYDRLKQAERNSPEGKFPVCVVKEYGKRDKDSVVMIRFGTFIKILKKGGIIE